MLAMRNISVQKQGSYKRFSGIYDSTGAILSTVGHPRYKRHVYRWLFIVGRLLALAAALALIIYSVSWASDGSWDIAGILFIAGMILFVPFILFGKKIKTLKKVKKYTKRNNPIIGWKYSG
jgi:glucan phosphoethanolaminetransferase (alkaline phosphatase superfamily)